MLSWDCSFSYSDHYTVIPHVPELAFALCLTPKRLTQYRTDNIQLVNEHSLEAGSNRSAEPNIFELAGEEPLPFPVAMHKQGTCSCAICSYHSNGHQTNSEQLLMIVLNACSQEAHYMHVQS